MDVLEILLIGVAAYVGFTLLVTLVLVSVVLLDKLRSEPVHAEFTPRDSPVS